MNKPKGKLRSLSPGSVVLQLRKIDAKTNGFLAEMQKEKDCIKSRCTHSFEYHSDPSGGNDCGYFCIACGVKGQ